MFFFGDDSWEKGLLQRNWVDLDLLSPGRKTALLTKSLALRFHSPDKGVCEKHILVNSIRLDFWTCLWPNENIVENTWLMMMINASFSRKATFWCIWLFLKIAFYQNPSQFPKLYFLCLGTTFFNRFFLLFSFFAYTFCHHTKLVRWSVRDKS